MLDVLLVNPPVLFDVPRLGATRRDPIVYDQPPLGYPPMGLAYLAAVLERDGFRVAILNAGSTVRDAAALEAFVRSEKPRVVGLPVLCFTLRSAFKIVARVRQTDPGAAIVLGNLQVADDPEVVHKMGADYGIRGEADLSFASLVRTLLRGEGSLDEVEGLVAIENGRVRCVPIRAPVALDDLPLPARHLLPPGRYFTPADGSRVTVVTASRGCPFRCAYCQFYSPEIRGAFPYRRRRADRVAEEMRLVERDFAIEYVEFVDDTFTVQRPYVLDLCRAIRGTGSRVRWGCETKASLVDPELLVEMKGAGCKKVAFGVETGNEAHRFDLEKRVTDEQVRSAFRECRRLGMDTKANFLLGLPGETERDLEETIRFACSLDATYAEFHVALILPNIRFYEEALRAGTVTADVFDRFMRAEVDFPRYVPRGLASETLDDYDAAAHRRFYFRPSYIWGRIRRIRRLRDFFDDLKIAVWLIRNFLFQRSS